MRNIIQMLSSLWWGSLSATGFICVPLLFANLPSKAMAGNMAAILFNVQMWLGIVCGALVIAIYRASFERLRLPSSVLSAAILGVMMAILVNFGAAPHIQARDNLAFWHAVGSGFFVLQWLCAGFLVFRISSFSDSI